MGFFRGSIGFRVHSDAVDDFRVEVGVEEVDGSAQGARVFVPGPRDIEEVPRGQSLPPTVELTRQNLAVAVSGYFPAFHDRQLGGQVRCRVELRDLDSPHGERELEGPVLHLDPACAKRAHPVRESGIPSRVQSRDAAVLRQEDVDIGAFPMRPLRLEQSSAAETPSLSFGDDLGECVVERLERCLEQSPGRLGKTCRESSELPGQKYSGLPAGAGLRESTDRERFPGGRVGLRGHVAGRASTGVSGTRRGGRIGAYIHNSTRNWM